MVDTSLRTPSGARTTTGRRNMSDEDLTIKIGKPTELDKATKAAASRPLSEDELKGFGHGFDGTPDLRPHVKVIMPSKETGHKGVNIEIGVQGTF